MNEEELAGELWRLGRSQNPLHWPSTPGRRLGCLA